MAEDEDVASIEVEKVNVEKIELPASTGTSAFQGWVSLTPLLSVVVTGIALVLSSGLQVYKDRNESDLKIDSEWRTALEKVDLDEKTAALAALEMQSFLEAPKHKEQARSLACAALPNIRDKYEFDSAFHVLQEGTNEENQGDLVGIARDLTNQIGDMHTDWKKAHKDQASSPDKSYKEFVLDPNKFFNEELESDSLKQVLAKEWELGTVMDGLSSVWQGKKKGSQPVKLPEKLDLSGITFKDADFAKVDLRHTILAESIFIGNCTVDRNLVPSDIKPDCNDK